MSDVITELAGRVGSALKGAGAVLTTAESCTGGGIAEAVTRIPGSSAWFGQGWVTYSNRAKARELGVAADLLRQYGAVSEDVVRAMATGAVAKAGATWAIAVSGVAGPDGGTPDKPVGTVWVAWAGPQGVVAERCLFAGNRDDVRRQTVERALNGLLEQMAVAMV